MTPATDGLATLVQIARYAGGGQLVRATGHGLRDATRALTKRSPHYVPVVGLPGSAAMPTCSASISTARRCNTCSEFVCTTPIKTPADRRAVANDRHRDSDAVGFLPRRQFCRALPPDLRPQSVPDIARRLVIGRDTPDSHRPAARRRCVMKGSGSG